MEEEKQSIENQEVEVEKKQFMKFRCCDEIYGISLQNVSEIIGLQQYTAIPETEDYIIGLINLRGKVIPIIDVRIRFGKEPLVYDDRTSVIVIQVEENVIGLIVDGIEGVANIADKNILPPPSVSDLQVQSRKYVFGIGRVDAQTTLLLNPEKLINDPVEDTVEGEADYEN